MPIDEPQYKFVRSLVAGAPEGSGIYALWEDGEMIYVGRANAMTIKQALLRHLEKDHCPCTVRATHYTWELSLRAPAGPLPGVRERRHQRLPRCNETA